MMAEGGSTTVHAEGGSDPAAELWRGPFPEADGWRWLYRLFDLLAPPEGALRRAACGYFRPGDRERSERIFRALGVHHFGRVIPTGGIAIRRLTGARMAAYTLRGSSLGAAREFFYRACVFEALHLPFLVALVVLTARQLALGRPDLALQDTLVNLVFNAYPILHHRRTRGRIVSLLQASARVKRRRRNLARRWP